MQALFCVLFRLKQKRIEWMTKGPGGGEGSGQWIHMRGPCLGGGDNSTAVTALTNGPLWMQSVHISPDVHFLFLFVVNSLFPKLNHLNFLSTPALDSRDATSEGALGM